VENRPEDNDGAAGSDGVRHVSRLTNCSSLALRLREFARDVKIVLHYPLLLACETVDVAIIIPCSILMGGSLAGTAGAAGMVLLTQIPLEIALFKRAREEAERTRHLNEWTQKKPLPELLDEYKELCEKQ
jgi:hypothetical protein